MIRSRFRSVLVAAVAILAVSASVASSASAAWPEWEGTGGKAVAFSGTLPGTSLEEQNRARYECNGGSISGQMSGTKEVTKVFIRIVCGNQLFCTKSGLKSNEWESTELKGRLGYLNKTERTVGLLLEPVAGHFADCIRSGVSLAVLNSMIGELLPLGKTRKHVLRYSQSEGTQSLRHFEGEAVLHNLEVEEVSSHTKQKLGLSAQWTLETAIEVGIRA
jgi:hypothetical protein